MRLVAVADTHLFHEGLEIPEGDVLVHAGDLCRHGDTDELGRAADWLASLPHRHKVVIAGNHDWAFVRDPQAARALLGEAHYLQDEELVLEGVRFWGSPWQPAYHDWAFNLPRGEALAAVWQKIPTGLDVLVTHGPPAGIGDRSPHPARRGCQALRERVEVVAPRVHRVGHIHQDGGAWQVGPTLFANVTTWEGCRGATVIELEPESARAVGVPPP
jgi:predicted phosphohydrolase